MKNHKRHKKGLKNDHVHYLTTKTTQMRENVTHLINNLKLKHFSIENSLLKKNLMKA